jgi:hypothetical protein
MGETNVVDVYIRYLRAKLDEACGMKLIHTVRGVGYAVRSRSHEQKGPRKGARVALGQAHQPHVAVAAFLRHAGGGYRAGRDRGRLILLQSRARVGRRFFALEPPLPHRHQDRRRVLRAA